MSYQFVRIAPRFVANLELAIPFYAKLGFEVLYNDGGFAMIKRDVLEFHINHTDEPQTRGHVWWVEVKNIEGLYQQCLKSVPESICSKPEAKDYGFKEFHIRDPFCNLILFAETKE